MNTNKSAAIFNINAINRLSNISFKMFDSIETCLTMQIQNFSVIYLIISLNGVLQNCRFQIKILILVKGESGV